MLRFSTALGEIGTVALEKSGICFSSLKETACGVPGVAFADT